MARPDGAKGRPAWSWVDVIAVALGLGTATTSSAGIRAGIEPNPAARWVAADVPIYLEVARSTVLIDHLLDKRLQAALDVVPSDNRSLKSDLYRQFRAVVDRLADTLGTTWQQGLRDLTSAAWSWPSRGRPRSTPTWSPARPTGWCC